MCTYKHNNSEDVYLQMLTHRTWTRDGRGCWRDARTFTAATFFAHLLTLRMFRVYFFNPVTLRIKIKEKRVRKERGHIFFGLPFL